MANEAFIVDRKILIVKTLAVPKNIHQATVLIITNEINQKQ